jgi:hypothetical protein
MELFFKKTALQVKLSYAKRALKKLISSTRRQHSTPSYDSSTIVFLVSNPTFPLPCAHHGVFYIIVYGVARGSDYYTHGV